MAMSTTLFAVTPEALAHLEANPESIHKLVSKKTYDTYLWTTLPYFLSGGADEDEAGDDDEAEAGDEAEDEAGDDGGEAGDDEEEAEADDLLASVLTGTRSVSCSRLENGAFHVMPVGKVIELAALLAAVKPSQLKDAVLDAELEDVLDGEVWEELEQLDLQEPEEVAAQLVKDLKSLVTFYAFAAKQRLAIVSYTT
ncbi:MAG TPA: DUF1877 family protein [Kofleriaceae bacterium]|nr:DUF1877 family protein [Kofleriaceae bacterium]